MNTLTVSKLTHPRVDTETVRRKFYGVRRHHYTFPTPNQNLASGLRIYYSKHPGSVGSFADGLGLPDRYHNSVVEYCLKMAYEMDENLDMAAFKKGEFSAQIQKLKDQEKWTST
jgi:hypothetical protein